MQLAQLEQLEILLSYLCNMLRQLTYLSLIVFVLIITSCSQDKKETIKNTNENRYHNKKDNHTSTIDIKSKYFSNSIVTNFDTSLLYHATITVNAGSFVDNSISEIAPLTTNITQNISNSNITYSDEIKYNGKTPIILSIFFDNDIFNNTDYYYTNGVNIELITPLALHSPISKLLIGLSNSQINYHGFSIKQNIYTPVNPDIENVSVGDRPFSAFLTIGQFNESYNLQKNLSIRSSLNLGVLGPASMGGVVQSSIHDIEPVGWNNQIKNTFVLDYFIKLEKGIISTPNLEINLTAGGNVGTIFNKINTGFLFRTGRFIPVLKGLKTHNSAFQYWFFISGETNLVFYDATLQGSLFNDNNLYTIHKTDINRLVVNASAGVAMYYKNVGFELQSFYLSPEFKDAFDFRWGRIKLVFQF